jgi:hypothetical protein
MIISCTYTYLTFAYTSREKSNFLDAELGSADSDR